MVLHDMNVMFIATAQHLCRFTFRSGNSEHPGDKFYNTSVELLLSDQNKATLSNQTYIQLADGFLILGWFNHETGVAEGHLSPLMGSTEVIRLRVHTNSEAWVILNEVMGQNTYVHMGHS